MMAGRVRKSSMSSREEERILDEYRKCFEDKASKENRSFVTHAKPARSRSRSKEISPYLQSVAPRNHSTIPKRPQSATMKIRVRVQESELLTIDKCSKAVGTQSFTEDNMTDSYSSSFTSSDSDDSNEKENDPGRKTNKVKFATGNRPTSAPVHRRRHTYDVASNKQPDESRKKNLPVYQRQPYTIRCIAYKNGSHQDGVTVVATNIKELLVEATRKLGLNTAGRRVYLEDGSEAFVPKDIPFEAKVYVSNGEHFKDPKKSLKYSGSLMQSSSWTSKGVVLEGDRKPRRRTASNRLRRLAGMQSYRILIFANGNGSEGHEVVHANNDKYLQLLDRCTSKLQLNSAGRITYGWNGKEVSTLQEVRTLDSSMKDGSTLIHGPLWVSSGEGFNPVGALNFVEGILWGMKKRIESAQLKMEQLEHACNGEMSKVHDKEVINLSPDDVYTSIDQVSQDIEDMKNAQTKYKEQLKILKKMTKDQEKAGNAYTMKHIKEIKSDDRIIGQHGLRLKIFENGKDVNHQTVFVNMREILRGIDQDMDSETLIRKRFLEHISHCHKPIDPSGPAKSCLVKRIFDKNGEEITDVKTLENDQKVWLSYGEDFKPSYVMTLHVQLQPVMAVILDGKDKVVVRREDKEVQKNTKFNAFVGYPENITCLKVISIGEQSDNYLATDHFLQAKDDPELVAKPLLMAEKLEKKNMPGMSQSWHVHRNGLITSRSFPQLALALAEDKPITVEMSCGASVSGYALALQKRAKANPGQRWKFSASGQICSLYNSSSNLVLTMLVNRSFNSIKVQEEKVALNSSENDGGDIPTAQTSSRQTQIVVLEKMTGSRAKFQRWALKQESVPNQWKFTKVANPVWRKLAYSWPVLPDGKWNMKYKWPMEGTFICSPPQLRRKEKIEASTTVPIRVFQNGEKDRKRFVCVVVPALSNGSSPANEKSTVDDAEAAIIQLEMSMFMERATSLLNLPFAARRIFDAHGQEIFSLRKLKRNDQVYVTCGESWKNPIITKFDTQRRQLLTKLASDVKKIHEFCILRDMGELVVSVESGIIAGSRLVVTQRIGKDLQVEHSNKECKETEEEKDSVKDVKDSRSCHQKSCTASQGRSVAKKSQCQQVQEQVSEKQEKEEERSKEKSPRTPKSQSRSPRNPLKSPKLLQKFVFNDGFISPEVDATLAFGVPGLDPETFAGTLEVRLCKKDRDDLTQRWDIRNDGTMRPMCDSSLGLTVCLPPISSGEERSSKSYFLILQKLRPCTVGSANQKWNLDQKTHLLKAFYSSVADKEVTAANHVSICTHAVRGPEHLNQDGYIVEMKGSLPNNPVMVCQSCATVMRGGRYQLTHAPTNWPFICSMGNPKKKGLKMQGSFKYLNGKVDLSTYEAEPTLNYWVSQLQRLRQETSMRTISREVNNVKCTQAWRLLIRKNGTGYQSKPEMVVGSSVTGVLDQCSQKLSSAARRLYTEDGTQILHMDQLKQWVERVSRENRKSSITQQLLLNQHSGSESGTRDSHDSNGNKDKQEKTEGNNSTEGTPNHSITDYGTEDLTQKTNKKNQVSLSQVVTEHLIQESKQLPTVEIWVSCGESFINPLIADKLTQESVASHMERNALNLEMDTQKHVIRQIHGRRRVHMNPAELVPTKDVKQPVAVTGGWTIATKEEYERFGIYNELKDTQRPKRPRSASRLQGNLYKQPQMKRITVQSIEDQTTSVYAWGGSMNELLDDAASKLNLDKIERVFYTKDRKIIKNFVDIKRNDELIVYPKRPGSTIQMKASWAQTRKIHGPEATEIVITGPRNEKKIAYVPPTNQLNQDIPSSSSSSSSDDE